MQRWLVVILIVFVQETVTLNGLLAKVFQGQFSIFIVTILFVFATVLDIFIGYWIELYVKKRWNKGKIKAFAKRWSDRLFSYVGKRGLRFYLLLLGYFSFPYLNSFITAWLDIPFWDSFWYLFAGNMIFYVSVSLLVLGITSVIPNPLYALIVVLAVTVAFILGIRILKSRKI